MVPDLFSHPLSLASLLPQKLLGGVLGWQGSTKSQGGIYLFNAMLYSVILVRKMVLLFHLELLLLSYGKFRVKVVTSEMDG